jgi:hypothetical protein
MNSKVLILALLLVFGCTTTETEYVFYGTGNSGPVLIQKERPKKDAPKPQVSQKEKDYGEQCGKEALKEQQNSKEFVPFEQFYRRCLSKYE